MNHRKLLNNAVWTLVLMLITGWSSDFFGQSAYMVSFDSQSVYEVDLSSGELISSTNIINDEGFFQGFYGMAEHPISGVVYALVDEGDGSRSFGVLDIVNGTYEAIGDVSYIMDSMIFNELGECFAMTATFDDTPARLVQIDITNGNLTILSDLSGLESFSQSLAFNTSDNTICRIEGGGFNPSYVFQTVNSSTYQIDASTTLASNVLDDFFPWALAMYYNTVANNFLVIDNVNMFNLSTSGTLTLLNPLPNELENKEVTGIIQADPGDQIFGCTALEACNYNPEASDDNGSCILPDGCTDVMAVNYNDTALCDDGSCLIVGCTNPLAENYSSEAAYDDGSCVLVSGCTYPASENYNPDAVIDDNTCILNCEETCPGDINADGSVTITDLSGFLSAFGTICE